jgi:poly(3-hydroxybutyrate) depolymerase
LTVSGHKYYVKLPAGYDPAKPNKVMIVFPPTGNAITWSEQSAGYEQAAPDAIRVYTHMAVRKSGWQPNETSFFKPFYDDITSRYCIDKNRVFAGGESSGGEFAGFIGCEHGDLVRGVIPNAPKKTSWNTDPASHTCKGNPIAIVSWSEKDSILQQPAGSAFRDFYRTLNMCQTTSTAVQGYTDALSNCKLFDGCKPGSNTYFCMHMDPNYGTTYHGWPKFIAKMSWEVFSKL